MHQKFEAFIINLEKSKTRKEKIIPLLSNLNFKYSFINAIDGRLLSEEEFTAYSYDPKGRKRELIKRNMTRGEVGASLSHLKAYREIANRDLEAALIFEDDAVFDSGLLTKVVSSILTKKLNWDIILLYHNSAVHRLSNKIKLDDNIFMSKQIGISYGAVAYMITQSAARSLIKLHETLKIADDAVGNTYLNQLDVFIVLPSIVNVSDDGISDIDKSGVRPTQDKYSVLFKLSKVLRSWFPSTIHQVIRYWFLRIVWQPFLYFKKII